jgi:iron complex outermembrane receptor protein
MSNQRDNLRKVPSFKLTPLSRTLQAGVFGLLSAGIAYTSGPAQAQPTGATSSLPPVTVEAAPETATGPVRGYVAKRTATATKTDTAIEETPQSISIITSDRIKATGSTSLTESLAYTPGVNSTPWGDLSQYDWVYLRGFDAYSPGFYLDGLQLRNTGSWGIWKTETYGTERIEVLRGPSSVLYGQGGPGGVINEVSKRPTAEPLRELNLQFGSHSSRQMSGDFSGPIDGEGKLLYRLVGLARDAQLSTGQLPNDRFFLAPSLTWRPSSDTTLTLLSQYLRLRSGSVWPSYPAAGTLLPNPNGRIPASLFAGEKGFNRYNQDQWMLGYLLEHKVNDTWTIRQNARHGRFDTDYKVFYNGDFVTVNEDNPADPSNFRLMSRTPFSSKEDATASVIDSQAQAKFKLGNWQHTLLFGLDYQRMRMNVDASYGGSAPDIDLFAPTHGGPITLDPAFLGSGSTLSQTGFYVQDQIKFGDRWVATLGGRYDQATVSTDDYLGNTATSQDDNKFTGRAGLVYLAPSGLAPYASYSESFSPTTTIDPNTGKPFKAETGRQYEAGLRFQPVGRKDSYSAAVFDTRRQNYVSYDEAFSPTQKGEVLVRGLELEASLQPIPRMNVVAAYTWTPKAVVTRSAVPSEVGKQANAVPKQQFALWTDYRFDGGFKAGIGLRHMGSTYGASSAAPAKIPGYTLVDAMLGYDFGHWSFALNLRNLTNKTYVANCDGYGTGCSYGAGRKVTGTATLRW